MDDVIPVLAAWWHRSGTHCFIRVGRRLLDVVEHLLRKGLESMGCDDDEGSNTCEMTAKLGSIQMVLYAKILTFP